MSKVTFDNYCGPTPESNWVVPNMLLVGAYPASTDDEETLDLITSILKQGVNKFVCLQQEVRTDCPTTLTGILFSPHPYNFSLSLSLSLSIFSLSVLYPIIVPAIRCDGANVAFGAGSTSLF